MSFELIKSAARTVGAYRAARWVNRHVLHRDELRSFTQEKAFYGQFVGPGQLCFDVGANYGTKAEVFLALGARVVAFEPQPDCLEELHARLGAPPGLVTVPLAVGSAEGTMPMYVQRHSTNSTLARQIADPENIVRTIEVGITTLDAAIARHGRPDFIKIDVEGFELEVLRGLSRPVRLVSFEYHSWKDGVDRALACLRRLQELGELEINFTAAEASSLAEPRWLPLAQFEPVLRQAVTTNAFRYGDIFVRTAGA